MSRSGQRTIFEGAAAGPIRLIRLRSISSFRVTATSTRAARGSPGDPRGILALWLSGNMNDTVASSVSPKQWVVRATSAPRQPMGLYCAERPVAPRAPGGIDGVSPVEFLLLAIAGCFALSCASALKSRSAPPTPVEVIVTGEKAHDAPSRLGRIALQVAFGGGMDQVTAAAVAQEAKRLCTVTNTILGAPTIEVTATTEC